MDDLLVTDATGRKLALRRFTSLDQLRLFKAAGAELSRNDAWLGIARLACSVTAINDVPVPAPATEQQIEAMVARLGSAAINAIAEALHADSELTPEKVAHAGN